MTAVAAVAGSLVDQMLGEPPLRWHPVARYGSAMGRIEARLYADRRATGIAFTAIGAGLGLSVALVLCRAVGPTLSTVQATGISAAGKSPTISPPASPLQLLHSAGPPAPEPSQLQ